MSVRVEWNDDGLERLKQQMIENGKEQIQAKWNAFCRQAKGKPEDEIRALVAQTWDGDLSDEAISALSRNEDVALNITIKE